MTRDRGDVTCEVVCLVSVSEAYTDGLLQSRANTDQKVGGRCEQVDQLGAAVAAAAAAAATVAVACEVNSRENL